MILQPNSLSGTSHQTVRASLNFIQTNFERQASSVTNTHRDRETDVRRQKVVNAAAAQIKMPKYHISWRGDEKNWSKTTSQAVASIADRTASQQTLQNPTVK